MRTTVSVECQNCGKPFDVEPSSLSHGRGKCCSRKCQYAVVGRKARARLTGRVIESAWEDRTCPVCGKVSRVQKSHPSIHCSTQCAHQNPLFRQRLSASLKNSTNRKPETREKMTATKRRKENRERNSHRASSQWSNPDSRRRLMAGIRERSASPEWRSARHFQKGKAHPKYKGNKAAREGVSQYAYKQWRTAVYRRDDFTCQSCGVRGDRLNAHHVKSWADFPELRYDVANGTTLCEPCHDKLHGKAKRPKTFACVVCGARKTDGRRPRCQSCGAKTRGQFQDSPAVPA